jgi:ATP-dependent RNA helicase MRH4
MTIIIDPDFQESTRMLLADISMARGHPIPYSPMPALSPNTPVCIPALPSTLEYPFNFLLASATIPSSLATYLDIHHPTLTRLASPNLHHLPKSLQTEYVSWTGGNRNADVERQIRRVWADDASSSKAPTVRSKMLVFCNKSTKVEDLGKFLEGKGIRNIALTSSSDSRKKGSNHHLDGFLGKPFNEQGSTTSTLPAPSENVTHSMAPKSAIPAEEPHVMITTSLLSRGLDFSPAIRHVLIVDEPRNMIDFLHRAGRTGRAGERGKVIVFGKLKGRGSDKAWEVRRKVAALAQRA